MAIGLTILMGVLAALLARVALDEGTCSRVSLLRPKNNGEAQQKESGNGDNEEKTDAVEIQTVEIQSEEKPRSIGEKPRWIAAVVLGIICAAGAWKVLTDTDDVLNIIRMFTALLCLTGSACVDFREERIPNIFPAVMAVVGLLCLGLGFLTGQEGAVGYAVSCGMATAGCAIALVIISFLTHKGIGAGDIKLLCALALLGGVYVVCGTLFFGVIACAIVGIALLISKKKTRKEALPFGPFLLFGYMVSIFMSIF